MSEGRGVMIAPAREARRKAQDAPASQQATGVGNSGLLASRHAVREAPAPDDCGVSVNV